MTWLEIAKNLPQGKSVRATCPECGIENKRNAKISHQYAKYTVYCFKCDFTDYEYKGQQTLQDISKLRELDERAKEFQQAPIRLPNDFSTDIPSIGRLWLYKAAISEATWKNYGIGYSPSMCRVILPVYNETNELVWVQARAVLPKQEPKYCQPSRERKSIMFQARCGRTDLQYAVITEDILSAIRVGKHVDCFSLLGTKLTTEQAVMLSAYSTIIIWLDGDKAGRKGTKNIIKSLSLITTVKVIRTPNDPKSYTNKEIKRFLCQEDM